MLGLCNLSHVPTALAVRNIRVAIHSIDHPPSHVHAIGRNGARARFVLNCPDGPVRVIEQAGFRAVDVADVGAAIAESLPAICRRWSDIHG